MKQKIINKNKVTLECSKCTTTKKCTTCNTKGSFVWNYCPVNNYFLCSGCGKEAVKFLEVDEE
tara:strand:+ start:230 stop:418 length:189 start_codon:yes stop_codon:yes gene_type:complete